ncbi:MAG: hypothetical protein WC867_03690, partial [Candidatus Pacearchaeota archaeon]
PIVSYNRFLNGIYPSSIGAKSVLVYAYGDWVGQAYDDMDRYYPLGINNPMSKNGQVNYELIVPTWEGDVLDTIAYESLREGIEDSRIIATLKKAINENSNEKSKEANIYLNNILAKPTPDYYTHYFIPNSSKPVEKYADRSEEILFDLSGNKQDYEFFDRTRKQMIEYIIEINQNNNLRTDNSFVSGSSGGGSFIPIKTTNKVYYNNEDFRKIESLTKEVLINDIIIIKINEINYTIKVLEINNESFIIKFNNEDIILKNNESFEKQILEDYFIRINSIKINETLIKIKIIGITPTKIQQIPLENSIEISQKTKIFNLNILILIAFILFVMILIIITLIVFKYKEINKKYNIEKGWENTYFSKETRINV